MVGAAKSAMSDGSAAFPATNSNETVYIVGLYNGNAAAATVSEANAAGSAADSSPQFQIKLKSGGTYTPAVPVALREGRKIHSTHADVTCNYVLEGGAAFNGPAGLTFTEQ
tara:strand:+ start:347 stop:679 length:333 start_codon:yes stop_codon:yes gene_type:complete